uniref:Uncharacterized protein n=1 Tax=Periophthalmus magnuspinnatus TaxID=409849 RepID=A0A3B4B2M0_9GOBI
MAQLRKVTTDAFRSNSRLDPGLPLVSLRQEILTSLVSALDSVCTAMSKLNAEVACVTVHEDSVIAVGTERGRVFLNSRREIQTDFFKFCRIYLKHKKQANKLTLDLTPNHYMLECMLCCAGDAAGKSSLVSVPYEWIQKNPGCVVASGLPEGVTLKRPKCM